MTVHYNQGKDKRGRQTIKFTAMLTAITLFLFLFPHFVQQSNTYIINGSFSKPQSEEWIYLVRFMDPDPKVDSTRIIDGKFTFKGSIAFPEIYTLYFRDMKKGAAPFFLEPGNLEIIINPDDWYSGTKISGGRVNEAYEAFNKTGREKYDDKIMELMQKRSSAGKKAPAGLNDQIKSLMDASVKYKLDYVKAHPASPESIFIFTWVYPTLSDEELRGMLSRFSPEIQQTAIYQSIAGAYELKLKLKNSSASLVYDGEIRNQNIDFGNAPVIQTLLRQNPGKALYIDFWAPWCGPCLREFPHSRELQEKMKAEKTAFLYVCVNIQPETKEEKWKEMIEKEQLNGQHYLWGEMLVDKFFKEARSSFTGLPRYVIIDAGGHVVTATAPGPGSDQTAAMLIRASE